MEKIDLLVPIQEYDNLRKPEELLADDVKARKVCLVNHFKELVSDVPTEAEETRKEHGDHFAILSEL